jgi:hypothetical protein
MVSVQKLLNMKMHTVMSLSDDGTMVCIRVPGGWIYKTYALFDNSTYADRMTPETILAQTFVPEPRAE